jgi:hypothetical protein
MTNINYKSFGKVDRRIWMWATGLSVDGVGLFPNIHSSEETAMLEMMMMPEDEFNEFAVCTDDQIGRSTL